MRAQARLESPQIFQDEEEGKMTMRSRILAAGLFAIFALLVAMASGAAPALAESHAFLLAFGSLEDPNGIAINQANGDVYVAAIGTNTVYKFDAAGNSVEFSALKSDALDGSATPAGSFSFPDVSGTPAAIAVDNSTSPSDPSAGDLYVMDAGHGVIDKFSPSGEYLNQITGFAPASPSGRELLGIGVDAGGVLHVDLSTGNFNDFAIDEFDDSAANRLIAEQLSPNATQGGDGVPSTPQAHGFAVSPTGDDYQLYEAPCTCAVKFGQQLSGLGRIDAGESGDVAIATDPATGEVYVQSSRPSVAEWDTGAMDRGSKLLPGSFEAEGVGELVSSFGSLSLPVSSSAQGGIAVNGASGEVYVSDSGNGMPGEGKVYVFGGEAPMLTLGTPTDVTRETAALSGTVDPNGATVSTCEFEYGATDEFGRGAYGQKTPCEQTPVDIGAGNSPVPVSAQIVGLQSGLLYHFRLSAANASGTSQSSGLFATAGVGFGIENFEMSFLNTDGTPDTQAGSHPHELVSNFTLYSHYQRMETNADSPYVREPNGTLKDVSVDLPPGLVGDPNATPKKCTLTQLREEKSSVNFCPAESEVGLLQANWSEQTPYVQHWEENIYNMVSPHGVGLQLGSNFIGPLLFINSTVRAGGDYPIQSTVANAPPAAPLLSNRLTIMGVVGEGESRKPFLTLPTGCHGPLIATMSADSYQEPGRFAEAKPSVSHNAAGTPVGLTGCSKLLFPPSISVSPDTTDASTSSGLTVGVHVSQSAAFNPDGLAESALRDTTVTLPEGVALNPAGADGLEACSEGLAGFEGLTAFDTEFEPGVTTATFNPTLLDQLQPGVSFCPDGSKIGTVKIKTPLLEHELEGAVYLANQNANPFGSLIAMYMFVEDPISGSVVKLTGEVRLSETGQISTTFENTPDLPFENLELHFFGGERAPLTTPSRCGTYTTQASFVPWDDNGPVNTSASFNIEHGPDGGPCPGVSLPFSPSLAAGTTDNQAGGFSPFTMTMSREDGQQSLQAVSLKMPPGLSGLLTGVELCPEPQADEGLCGPGSLIGETTVSVGVGNDPFSVKGGRVYLTGPYKGAPFGLSIVNPTKAGPFDVEKDTSNPGYDPPCDCLVVRARIEVNPITADLTITSDNEGTYKIPPILDGIPLQIKHVNVTIDRAGFTFNPTNCSPTSIAGSLDSTEGSSDTLSVPFQATNCARLSFKPGFSVSTSGKTSRKDGASLHAKLVYPKLPFGTQANIATVKVDLPRQLPSRLSTLQKACVDAVFAANPSNCPAASRVGMAKATTPLLPVPLSGPAYFVSHGGAKFPELIVVLEGYGVTVDLHSETYISKAGITSSTFRTVPDVPVGTFELTLPEGKYSALAANGNLCKSKLKMPTAFTAQNGAVIHESTPIAVTGCPKHKAKRARKAGSHTGARGK
jgi:hypothetical protein